MVDNNKNHFVKVAAKCEQCSVIIIMWPTVKNQLKFIRNYTKVMV